MPYLSFFLAALFTALEALVHALHIFLSDSLSTSTSHATDRSASVTSKWGSSSSIALGTVCPAMVLGFGSGFSVGSVATAIASSPINPSQSLAISLFANSSAMSKYFKELFVAYIWDGGQVAAIKKQI